jgi:hypothetical protein
MGHIHAELMAQYAEDAKRYDKPWELWQHGDGKTWKDFTNQSPGWHTDIFYRRKPQTIKIGDIEVPEPCKVALEYGQEYFVPDVATEGASLHSWNGDPEDIHALESKLVHLDRRSAVRHALALIKVSKGWWK